MRLENAKSAALVEEILKVDAERQAAEDEAELTIDEYTAAAAADPDSAEREIAFAVPIDDHNELQVEAELLFDEAVNLYYYRITRWQVTVFDRPTDASQLEVLPDGRIGW